MVALKSADMSKKCQGHVKKNNIIIIILDKWNNNMLEVRKVGI